ncbi:unnamed protein product [Leptosia nina]|uniref:Uncharacterized protein n=1 Tax=Leptosia nina TaxID=320188 RepID=A0AAV1J8Q8_9NEOP
MESMNAKLGLKHQKFNELVDNTVRTSTDITPIDYKDLDINNLLKIEVACRTRNINFILNILKCKNMLYVSRAIKLSTWLLTEDQYSHIINPDYIHTNLLPFMMWKAFNKLMLKIRLTLKDEGRVDGFFKYFEVRDLQRAFKWLPHCSPCVAEEAVEKYAEKIPFSVLKKFKYGSNCVYIYCKRDVCNYDELLQAINLLLVNNTEKYLDFVFGLVDGYNLDKFTPQTTKRIIKRCPNESLDSLLRFTRVIHIPTLAKFFNKEEIKNGLINNSRSKKYERLYKYDKLKYFVRRLPEEDKIDLIKNVFIGKQEPDYTCENDLRNSTLIRCLTNMNNAYLWCELLPFDDAFIELKRFIAVESNPAKRSYMLCTLLSSAHRDANNIQVVLQYYFDFHMQEGVKFKTQFLQHILKEVNTLKLNAASWNLLNCIFYSVGVYTRMDNNFPQYRPNPFIIIGKHRRYYDKKKLQSDDIFVDCVILYNVVHDIDIPDVLIAKFKFNTMKNSENSLKAEEKNKLFEFLLALAQDKLDKLNVNIDDNFEELLVTCKNILKLFKDWNRQVAEHPNVLTKMKEFAKSYSETKTDDMKTFYEMAKSMKVKLVDSEQLITAELCMNALKYNPQLLTELNNQNKIVVELNKKSMRRFLNKIRVYYYDSFAVTFKDYYMKNNIKIPWGLISGKDIHHLISEFLSSNKIDWSNDITVSLAKHAHLFKTFFSLDNLLDYITDNKLSYFLPPLYSITYDMYLDQVRDVFIKLDQMGGKRKEIRLKRHCLRVILDRVTYDEASNLLIDIWKVTKVPSTRVLIFELTWSLLSKAKNKQDIMNYWNILSNFIDDIDENILKSSSFLTLLCNYAYVPELVQEDYYDKVHSVLRNLPDQSHLQAFLKKGEIGIEKSVKALQKALQRPHFYCPYGVHEYLLNANSVESQMKRYERLLVPIMEDQKFKLSDKPFVSILRDLTKEIHHNVTYRDAIVPLNIFKDILERLEKQLDFFENYVLITAVKLILGYLNILNRCVRCITDKNEISLRTNKELAEFCGDFLDREIATYYPRIYMSFSDALHCMSQMMDNELKVTFLDHMLTHNPRSECYFVIIPLLPRKTYRTPDDIAYSRILEKIRTHPCDDVRMLYSNYFIKTDSL